LFSLFLTQNSNIIFGPIARALGWILNVIFEFLSKFGIENAGLCIIIFTFLVNALMIPLTIKQQKFTKLSSVMNPELQKIQKKYAGKKDEASMRKMQLENQAVYEKYGANPTAGCLPLLITFPIMLALYRVIYNIPAYVQSIKALYQNIATAMQTTDYVSTMSEYASKFATLKSSKWTELLETPPSISVNHLIDTMGQFKSADWESIISNQNFASISDTIQTNADRIMHINNFGFGLNISESPIGQMTAAIPIGTKIAYLMIPVLAVVTQVISTKLMMAKQPQQNSGNETMDATMKSMNTFMPLMSGVFCLSLPVGVGIYWIAGAVFRGIQQFFVNMHLDKMDVEELIAQNREKQKRKKEKQGIDTSYRMEELAKQRTSTMGENARINTTNISPDRETVSTNKSYKSGSIAANAHLLDKNRGEKENK
jgi:YidC/Oxa1 family membrane protein insertase